MVKLGEIYKTGAPGVLKNLAESNKWYNAALKAYIENANKNIFDKEIPFTIAGFYEKGLGINKDIKEAINWYKKAADTIGGSINYNSMFRLNMIFTTEPTVKNSKEAEYWLNRALETIEIVANLSKDGSVYCDLGRKYEVGEDVIKDKNEAVKWYRKASDMGDLSAIDRLKTLGL